MILPRYSASRLEALLAIQKAGDLKPVPCGFCGTDNPRLLLVEAGLRVVRCGNCGFVYTNPVPAEVHLSVSPQELAKDVAQADQKQDIFQPLLKQLQQLAAGGQLLDVGCGVGIFMRLAAAAGFQVSGLDLNHVRVAYLCQNTPFEVRCASLETAGFDPEQFDVITLLEVLEHVERPRDLLAACHAALRPGGVLVIEVPNLRFQLLKTRLFQFCSRLTGQTYYGLLPFMHLLHFTGRSLSELVRDAGFELVCFQPRGAYFNPGEAGIVSILRRLHGWLTTLAESLLGLHLGTALVVFCRKPAISPEVN